MEDFKFTIQYKGREILKLNTKHVQEDVIRTKMGLEPHKENNNCK